MPERIYKLQPDRTVHLRGFDTFAAAACIHSASPSGFAVSGTFRDPADFAVVVLYDADNFYEHPSIKYLPDFNFSGLALNFNLNYSGGLQPIDSPKFPWIDWAMLDCVLTDGTATRVRLWDNATLVGSTFPAASATCNVITSATGIDTGDRITLWYQNVAFDYFTPETPHSAEFTFFDSGVGSVHTLTVNGRVYSHKEIDPLGETGSYQASALIAAMASDPDVSAAGGSKPNSVLLKVLPSRAGVQIPVSASDGNAPSLLRLTSPEMAAAGLAQQINATDWVHANTTHALLAQSSGPQVRVTAARYGKVNVSGTTIAFVSGHMFTGITPGSTILISGLPYSVASVESPSNLTLTSAATVSTGAPYVALRGGYDGNLIELYATSSSPNLSLDSAHIPLSGGSSDVTWNCNIDFSALKIDQLRQCWLTFAPALVNGIFPGTEWEATFSNWTLTGPETTKTLSMAGPGSVRIEETDSGCTFTPKTSWSDHSDFYSEYFAKSTSDQLATAAISYTCQFIHDLYIGTSLDGSLAPDKSLVSNRAVVGIRVDGDSETSLDCRLNTGTPLITRRLIRSKVPAGRHSVAIRLLQPGDFYFDFLEAAVVSDFPDSLPPRTNISPALDFDTDHTYKLSPSRLMWIFEKLGYAGPMNEYLGVFWWNERVLSGGSVSTAQVSFTGPFVAKDEIVLNLSDSVLNKTILNSITDTPEVIARHFADYVNGAFVDAWASANGNVLTLTSRSPAPAYNLITTASTTSGTGSVQITMQPVAGQYGTWVINDSATPPLNRAARDWHSDFYTRCASLNREVVTACSMELVNPPDGYVARFPGPARIPVSTATGFGTLVSNHCAAGGAKLMAYQKAVYRCIAQLQSAAGLVPCVQYGEFLWWYFALAEELKVGYASYTAPVSIGTATPHGLSDGAGVVISGVAGNTAANGRWTITITDSTHFTLNGSSGNGTYTSGGAVFGGGMAFYDDETMAAAQTALGRPLHVFNARDDDPSINAGADATFLRNRLRDHVSALVTDIRAAYPKVKCELLWPYDVNHPTLVPANAPYLGGQVVRFVNLPVEWQTKPTSGLDRVKVEALAFSSGMRNLDLSLEAIQLFPDFGWPLDSLRYLLPVFGSATPWNRELALALGAGIRTNNMWAFDHICLYNLDVPELGLDRRSVVQSG